MTEIDRNNNIHHVLPNIDPFNHILFADDMSCFAQNNTDMQLLMDVIQEFEEWSGMPVNTFKTKQMTVDDVRGNRATTEKVTYNKEILLIVPESEPVRYLGFWATPNGNMQAAKDLVYERTLTTKETIRDHPLDPKQAIEIFSSKAIGNFRYLAVVTSWSRRDLNRLDRYWCQGFKMAWRLNESTADHPWTTPKSMSGMDYNTTLALMTHSLHAHVERCMKTRDVTFQMMQNDLHRAMKE